MLNGLFLAADPFPGAAARGMLEKCDPPVMRPSPGT
jgi:hypothetical protein